MSEQSSFVAAFQKWLLENTKDLPVDYGLGDCPICEKWAGEDYHLVACFGLEPNIAASMSSGPWGAEDWKELRRCECGVYFVVENSNY